MSETGSLAENPNAVESVSYSAQGEPPLGELNPSTPFAPSWHHEIIAAKLEAVREGRIRRLIVNVPPRHQKSHLASAAFPAWCLGHDPSAQLLCVSYAQDLADKLSRDCRQIVASDWYRQLFATRLSAQRQATRGGHRGRCPGACGGEYARASRDDGARRSEKAFGHRTDCAD